MRRYLWLILGIVAGFLALFLLVRFYTGREYVATDLMAAWDRAEKRPAPESFEVAEVTVAGETRQAIRTQPTTRLIWQERIPANAWLDVSMAVEERAWTVEGDGVLFRVGVSDDDAYDELMSVLINPLRHESDRRWHDVLIDLSPYEGQVMNLIFNVNAGPNDSANTTGDLALWSKMQVVVR